MSAFYTTKALGRQWLPSPIRGSQRGRFESWPPLHPPKLRQPADTASSLTFRRWSKAHDRIALAVLIIITLCLFGGSLRHHLQYTFAITPFHLPSFAHPPLAVPLEVVFPGENLTWSSFAYITYATDLPNLCSSLQLLSSLQTLDVRPDRLLLYPQTWDMSDLTPANRESRLLRLARDVYGARLQPITPYHPIESPTVDGSGWKDSFTKLLAINQTQYRRVLHLDSDATLRKPLDQLFLLPAEIEIAMPRAYWLPETGQNGFVMPPTHTLSSALMLLTPSAAAMRAVDWHVTHRRHADFDMEVMNKLFYAAARDARVYALPHRTHLLLTGELRERDHARYLGDGVGAAWDARREVAAAHYIHFSDFPLPKPWAVRGFEPSHVSRPVCRARARGVWGAWWRGKDCRDRDVWDGLYRDFRERRRRVCGVGFDAWGDVPVSTPTSGGRDDGGEAPVAVEAVAVSASGEEERDGS